MVLHANLDLCVSFQRYLAGICPVLDHWVRPSQDTLSKEIWVFQRLSPGLPQANSEIQQVPAGSNSTGVGSQLGQSLPLQPTWGSELLLTCRDAGSSGQQDHGRPTHHLLSLAKVVAPFYCLHLRNTVAAVNCLHYNSIRCLFPQEPEQQHHTKLISPSGILVPGYFIYLPF